MSTFEHAKNSAGRFQKKETCLEKIGCLVTQFMYDSGLVSWFKPDQNVRTNYSRVFSVTVERQGNVVS